MLFESLLLIAVFVVAYGLVSRRLQTTPITGPMVFVAFGILMGPEALGWIDFGIDNEFVRLLAEATLVLVLYTDAIRIDVRLLRRQAELPGRLLSIGLPLTVAAGTLVAALVFTDWGIWEAALLAAILTPTDAALGQAVVTNARVPVRIRQALNVESGLNDGIMLPVITLLLAFAAVEVDLETPSFWAEFVLRQIGFGVLAGLAIGWVGGRLLDVFSTRGWVDGAYRQLATLAIGVGAFAGAEIVDGNGFVAAFVAGLAFGVAAREHCEGAYDFAEDEGQLLTLLTFLVFGVAIAGPALGSLDWRIALYALLSLFLVRAIPVAISVIGAHLRLPTVAFLGWFGPRGLASILFGLFVLEDADLPRGDDIFLVVTWTVLFSVFLHGVSALPLSERYGAWFRRQADEAMPEAADTAEMPTR